MDILMILYLIKSLRDKVSQFLKQTVHNKFNYKYKKLSKIIKIAQKNNKIITLFN